VETDAKELYDWLTNDFESAWNALAALEGASVGRGNFAFALQATVLLELACRLCNGSPQDLSDLATAMYDCCPVYFVKLPGEVSGPRDFDLPNFGYPRQQLLTLIFDLIRNGQAHRYLQISASLSDGTSFHISIGGAHHGNSLHRLPSASTDHLRFSAVGEVGILLFDPGVFYHHLKTAVDDIDLFSRGLSLEPQEFMRKLPFTLPDLAAALGALS